MTYLRGRALSESAAAAYRIGLVADPLPEHRQYAGRLAVPILKEGTPVSFFYRCIRPGCSVNTPEEEHEGHPKTLSPAGERRWLFGTDALRDPSPEIDLCEGEWDPIALSDALGLAALGIPGAKAWKKRRKIWKRLFEGHRVVRFWADPDGPGRDLCEQVRQDIPRLRVVELEWDVNETLRREGAGALLEAAGL